MSQHAVSSDRPNISALRSVSTVFVLAFALLVADGSSASAQEKSPLLIMVTSENPQVQLMAMVLGMQSVGQGVTPRVLLCGEAGDMALIDAPASAVSGQPPRDMSPQGLMQSMMDRSAARVEVCAIYMPAKGIDGTALVEGVTAADPAEIGELMIDPNVKVVSF